MINPIQEGNCLKGYCVQCRADWPNSSELWKVSQVGVFYCQEHLKELGYEKASKGIVEERE